MSYVLAIDQGTTSTRAIVFDKNLQIVASSQKEIEQFFPFPGWVEHDLEEIYATVIATVRDAVKVAENIFARYIKYWDYKPKRNYSYMGN